MGQARLLEETERQRLRRVITRLLEFGPADHRLTGRTERSRHVHLDLARSELDSLWNSDGEQAVLETRFDPLGLELAA